MNKKTTYSNDHRINKVHCLFCKKYYSIKWVKYKNPNYKKYNKFHYLYNYYKGTPIWCKPAKELEGVVFHSRSLKIVDLIRSILRL